MTTHEGAKLQDMFTESQQGAACSFKEPPEHGGKFRWQIIHLRDKKDASDQPTATGDDGTLGSQEVLVTKEKSKLVLVTKKRLNNNIMW